MKYNPSLAIAICAVLMFVSCQRKSTFLNQGKLAFLSKEKRVEVPFSIKAKYMVVPVILHQDTLKFLFDTGAPTSVRSGIAKAYNLPLIQKDTMSDVNNIKQESDFVRLPSLTIGESVKLHDNPAFVFSDENFLCKCLGFDGILGSNSFRNHVISIDRQNHTLIISHSIKNISIEGATKLKMQSRKSGQSSPVIQIKPSKSSSEWVLFDSGFNGFYSVGRIPFERFQGYGVFDTLGISTGYNTFIGMFSQDPDSIRSISLSFPEFQLGDIRVHHVSSESTNDDYSKLGVSLTSYGVVTIDFRKDHFYFTPNTKDLEVDREDYAVSITYRDGLRIAHVYDEKIGLTPGQKITKINNKDVKSLSFCEALQQDFSEEDTTQRTITVMLPEGVERTYEIPFLQP